MVLGGGRGHGKGVWSWEERRGPGRRGVVLGGAGVLVGRHGPGREQVLGGEVWSCEGGVVLGGRRYSGRRGVVMGGGVVLDGAAFRLALFAF